MDVRVGVAAAIIILTVIAIGRSNPRARTGRQAQPAGSTLNTVPAHMTAPTAPTTGPAPLSPTARSPTLAARSSTPPLSRNRAASKRSALADEKWQKAREEAVDAAAAPVNNQPAKTTAQIPSAPSSPPATATITLAARSTSTPPLSRNRASSRRSALADEKWHKVREQAAEQAAEDDEREANEAARRRASSVTISKVWRGRRAWALVRKWREQQHVARVRAQAEKLRALHAAAHSFTKSVEKSARPGAYSPANPMAAFLATGSMKALLQPQLSTERSLTSPLSATSPQFTSPTLAERSAPARVCASSPRSSPRKKALPAGYPPGFSPAGSPATVLAPTPPMWEAFASVSAERCSPTGSPRH